MQIASLNILTFNILTRQKGAENRLALYTLGFLMLGTRKNILQNKESVT